MLFQKITKKNNILPLWGNSQSMNLNALVLENIIQCTYYKNYLAETTGFQQLTEEIYYNARYRFLLRLRSNRLFRTERG